MHKFVRNLMTEWRKLKLPLAGETFIVAVSGGADSVALFLAIGDLRDRKKLKNRFVVAHFNHNLRAVESEKDAAFVKSLCAKFDFELVLKKGSVAKKGNLEQNARLARYEFLTRSAESLGARAILTAHTVNDQAETLLINLLRGSGLRGLSAMPALMADFKLQISNSSEKSQIPNPKFQIELVRPLLNWATREDTETYCREREIEFRGDAMNEDLAFKRVRIRKVLLPLLEDFNPKIVETLAQTARVLRSELEFIEETRDRRPQTEDESLSLKELKNLSKAHLYAVLRDWLETRRGDLRQVDLKHIEAIERLISSRKSGRKVELPGGETIEKKDGRLFFRQQNIDLF